MKSILVIGGTGILGKPLVMQLIKNYEYNIHSISLDKAQNPFFPSAVKEIIID